MKNINKKKNRGQGMKKNKLILFMLVLITLSSMLFIQTDMKVVAEEEICSDDEQTPTTTGESVFPENWNCTCNPYEPMTFDIVYDPLYTDTLKCGYNNVTINVIGGCPSFSAEVSGQGYTLTKIDGRKYSLSCAEGSTWGNGSDQTSAVATVIVTDSCDQTSIKIRSDDGDWILCGASSSVGCTTSPIEGSYITGQYLVSYRVANSTFLPACKDCTCDGAYYEVCGATYDRRGTCRMSVWKWGCPWNKYLYFSKILS